MFMGCYFVMDCDNCWEWVFKVFDVMIYGQGFFVVNIEIVISEVYGCDESDEFIQVIVLGDYVGVKDGDGIFCLNFCVDCVCEILVVMGKSGFFDFDIGVWFNFIMLGMVDYFDDYKIYMILVYFKKEIVNMFGEWVVKQGKIQFCLVEIEKYLYVIFFLNGGEEILFEGEDCYMLKFFKVVIYDL